MDSEFQRFLDSMLGGGNAMGRQAAGRVPMMPQRGPAFSAAPPVPQPVNDPFPAIQRAAAGMPPELVEMIARAASMAPRQQQAAPPMPQPVAQPPIDPNLVAGSGIVSAPIPEGNRTAKDKVHGQAAEGEGYVIVEYSDEAGPHVIFVPESYAEQLPQDTRVISEGVVTNPQQIENARKNGALLEQQPTNISTSFRNTKTSEQVYNEGAGQVDRTNLGNAPTVIGEKTDQQALDSYNDAAPVTVVTATEIAASDPELAAEMEANGITEVRSDQNLVRNEQGKLMVQDKVAKPNEGDDFRVNPEPVGTELPELTRQDLRDQGMENVANQMEAQGIYSIPDGSMLVKDGSGKLAVVPLADTAPTGMTIVVYGGKSEELNNQGRIMPEMSLTKPKTWLGLLEPAAPVLSLLDKPRQLITDGAGEDAYRKATGNDNPIPGADDIFSGVLKAVLPEQLEENTGLPITDFDIWAKNNPDAVIDAYENGYTDPETGETFTEGRAVWEKYSSTQPIGQRVVNDIAMDPLNAALPVGGSIRRGAAKVAGDAATTSLGRRILSTGLDATGKVLQAPDLAMDALMRPGTRAATAGLDKALAPARTGISKLIDPSSGTRIGNVIGETQEAAADILRRARREAPEPAPAQVGATNTAGTPGQSDILTAPAAAADADYIMGTKPDGTPYVAPIPNAAKTVSPGGVVDNAVPSNPLETVDNTADAQALDRSEVDQEFLDGVGEGGADAKNPFEGMKLGEAPQRPDWDFLTPREREEMGINELNRIIDAIYQKHKSSDLYKQFGAEYEPLGLNFIAQERRALKLSKDGRPAREAATRRGELRSPMDYSQKRLSAVNEARHVTSELIPTYRRVFGADAELPNYRFKTTWKDPKTTAAARRRKSVDEYLIQDDDGLIERAVFGDEAQAAKARAELERRGSTYDQRFDAQGRPLKTNRKTSTVKQGDPEVARLLPYIDRYRGRYLRQLDGSDVVPTAAAPAAPSAPLRDAVLPAEGQSADWDGIRITNEGTRGGSGLTRTQALTTYRAEIGDYSTWFRRNNDGTWQITSQGLDVVPGFSKVTLDDVAGRIRAERDARRAAGLSTVPPAATVTPDVPPTAAAPDVPTTAPDDLPGTPPQQGRLFSSAVPGGPQLSDALTNRVGNDLLDKQVRNPFYKDATDNRFLSQDTSQVQRFMGRVLSEKEAKVVNLKFSDGETLGRKWERYADELEQTTPAGSDAPLPRADAEMQAAATVLDEYAADFLKQRYKDKYKVYEAAVERIRKSKDGKNLDESVIHARALGEATDKSPSGLGAYDTTLAVLREMTLYNSLTGLRYVMTQGVGNTITALLTGHGGMVRDAFRARNVGGAYTELNNAPTDIINRKLGDWAGQPMTRQEISDAVNEVGPMPAHLIHDDADQIIAELGFGGARHDVSKVVRDQVTEVGSEMRLKSVADNLRLGRLKMPSKWTGVFANRHVRDFANSLDVTMRKTLYATQLRANVAELRPDFREMMRRNLPAGADAQRFDEIWDALPETFGSDRIRMEFDELGGGYSERMARDWQNSLNKVDRAARDEVGRVFFTGDLTNADEILKRVVFFHYWMSRATPLYTTSIMRHPGILNGYINMMQEMEQQAESGRYGAAVNGFLRIFGTYHGFNIFIRPDAFFQTVLALGEPTDFQPENETGLGAFLRKFPLFVNPLVASGINFLGYSGNTFAPDPLMLGNWSNLVTNGLNLLDAHFGTGTVNSNGYQDLMSWIRSETSGVAPGSTNIDYTESTMYARRDLNYLIMDVAEENGLDPTGVEAQAAMDDPNHPFHREAFKRYANGQGLQQAARILPTSVLYPKFRVNRGDEIRYNINEQTRPGSDENEMWREQRAMAQTIDPRSRALLVQGDEYYAIGTVQQRKDYGLYNGIRYGGLGEYVVIDGVTVGEKQLMNLTEEERKEQADKWAKQNGKDESIDDLREQRKEYNDTHPQWKAYQEWAGSVRDYEGGPDMYWEDLIRGNPNAARWYEDNVTSEMTQADRERLLTGTDAYMATQGIQSDMYQPAPISVRNNDAIPYTPSSPSSDSGSSGKKSTSSATTAENIYEDMTTYDEEMAAFNAAAGVNIDGLNPMARSAYLSNLRDQGIEPPYMPRRTQLYLEWRDQQPLGAPNRPEDYIRWLEKSE